MTKHLRFLFIALLMAVWTGGLAQEQSVSLNLSGSAKFGTTSGSKLTQNKVTWTVTSSPSTKGAIQNSFVKIYKGQQFGVSGTPWCGTFSTSDIKGTIKSIAIAANTSGAATLSVKVGNQDYTCNSKTSVAVQKISGNINTYTFQGNTSGDIVITLNGTSKACYLGSIKVTYSTAPAKTTTTTTFGENSKKAFTFVNGVLEGFTAPTATVTPAEAQSAMEYWSDNENVVKVGTDGALTFGTVFDTKAKIYAGIKDGNDTYEASSDYYTVVNTSNLTATSLSFNGLTGEGVVLTEGLLNGATFNGYVATEANSIPGKITYSADGEVATVNAENGQVTINATKYGTSTITATFTPNDAATYLQSTASYTIQNTKKIDESTIVFDFTSDKYDATVIGVYDSNTNTPRTFPSVAGKNYEFTLTSCMYNSKSLQLKKNSGILVSPTFNSFPNGYKVVVTYNNNAPTLSSNECKDAKANINSTAKTITIELPSPSATFTIKASTSGVTNINNITLTALKPTPTLSFANASVDVALEDKTATVQTITTAEGFDGTITYESSNNEIATVEGTTINLIKEGEVDIIAKSAETETYAAGTASYKLVIKSNLKDSGLAFDAESYDFDIKDGIFEIAKHLVNNNNLTVTYATSGDALIDETTGEFFANTIGTYIVTATFTGNTEYRPTTATCTINVTDTRETPVLTFDASWYNIVLPETEFESATHLTNPNNLKVKYSITPNTSCEIDANTGYVVCNNTPGKYTITATFDGDKTYKPTTTICNLLVSDANILFYESFDGCYGIGGNDGQFSGTGATNTVYDNTGWEEASVKGAAKCIKIGISDKGGKVTSPSITIDKVALLTFNLASWSGENSNVTITINNGTLGYNSSFAKSFTLTPSDSKFDNVEMIVKASSPFTIDFSCSEGKQRFFLDEVKVTEIKAKAYTFDETSESNTIESYENANVTLKRSNLVTDNWNTFCVPFAISAEEIAATWGEGTELRTFDSMSGTTTMNFKKVESIEAGKPYLVKPANATTGDLTFNGVQTMANAENKVGEAPFYMVGTYNAIQLAEDGSNLFLATGNEFKKPILNSAKMKGMRVYFEVPANTEPAALRANIDGVETGINAINGIEGNTTAPVYNLQGQCVGNSLRSLAPGIYVQGGKKFVVK